MDVQCEITKDELLSMNGIVPFAVQVRQKLNRHGFKFEDDGKLSSIINMNPKPIGEMVMWEDYKTGSIHYRQNLPDQ